MPQLSPAPRQAPRLLPGLHSLLSLRTGGLRFTLRARGPGQGLREGIAGTGTLQRRGLGLGLAGKAGPAGALEKYRRAARGACPAQRPKKRRNERPGHPGEGNCEEHWLPFGEPRLPQENESHAAPNVPRRKNGHRLLRGARPGERNRARQARARARRRAHHRHHARSLRLCSALRGGGQGEPLRLSASGGASPRRKEPRGPRGKR